ncbi:hypothetical protein A3860_34510 [Niastella vici]|uniref:Transporter n=1 Tax=Niastella vici TaxID=1703345 RepID=A0A1V9FPA4_9BACT|nr:TolC family protein [Niastella vici]OQP60194.1 hypothetical protein A3860_34510 [Niastella vici]
MVNRSILILLLVCCSSMLSAQYALEDYIQTAKDNSPLLKSNKNQSEATRIEIERLKAVYTKPQVGLTANYLLAPVLSQDNGKTTLELNPTNPEKYFGYDVSTNNGGLYQGVVGISQPLFNQSKFKVVADEAIIGTQVNENNIRLTSHEIEKIVTDQYIFCLQDNRQIEFYNRYIALLQEQKELVTKLINASLLKLSDLSLLNIELQIQVINLNTAQTSYRKNLLGLNILSGINDTSYHLLNNIDLQLKPDEGNSAFTQQFSLDSALLIAHQNVFELRYKPQVNAFANAGLTAVNISTLYRRFGVNAGFGLTWNLFDGRQKELTRSRTKVLLKSSGAYKENFITQNTVRKNSILIELKAIRERTSLTDSQLREYDKLLENYKQQLSKGQISVIDYLNTVKNAMALQKEYILMQANQQLLINAYNYWNW